MQNGDECKSNYKGKKFSTIKELKVSVADKIKHKLDDWMCDAFDESIRKSIAEQMSEAILEDIYIEYFAEDLWKNNINFELAKKMDDEVKKDKKNIWNIDKEHKSNAAIGKIEYIIKKGQEPGLSTYTSRYTLGNQFSKMKSKDNSFLMECVDPDLYEKIYPVFWLEMLNRNTRDTYDFYKYLLEPINGRSDWEKYIFALLIDERKGYKKGSIFSIIRKELFANLRSTTKEKFNELYKNSLFGFPDGSTDEFLEENQDRLPTEKEVDESEKRLKSLCKNRILNKESFISSYTDKNNYMITARERYETVKKINKLKELIKEYEEETKDLPDLNLNDKDGRIDFVCRLYNILLDKKITPSQTVLKNNIVTLKDLIEIGVDCGMDKPEPALFLYFLERLTGWIGFYFYASLCDDKGDYQPYSVYNDGNYMAMFYCWKKYIKERNSNEYYTQSIHIRDWLIEFILDIYRDLFNENRMLIYENGIDCKIYREMYRDLFEKNTIYEESECYTRIDVLNYYCDLFIEEDDDEEDDDNFPIPW